MIEHTEALDCPCKPVTVQTLGGGRVQVHRDQSHQGERKPQQTVCPGCGTAIVSGVQDPYCAEHQTWHNHGDRPKSLLRQLEEEVMALPTRHYNHTGSWIERAAVLALLDPRKRKAA